MITSITTVAWCGFPALSTSEADRSRRANQHLAMVSYVLTRWDEAGLLYAKPAELSVWMCEFLLSTVRELTYEQRVQFAASYQELIERFDLTKSILSTPAAASRHRSLCVSAEDEPQVSAIVVPSPGRPGQEACIASLLTQELAQLEVICVDGTESGVPEAFAGDARVRTAASLADAFAQARGELTLLAESGDAYEAYALRIMADTAQEGDECADVVTIQDRGGSLRVADLSAFLHATSQDGSLRETTWTRTRLAFDELPQSPAELFSLSASNSCGARPLPPCISRRAWTRARWAGRFLPHRASAPSRSRTLSRASSRRSRPRRRATSPRRRWPPSSR